MVKVEIEKTINQLQKITKKLESTRLTCKTRDLGYETIVTFLKANQNKIMKFSPQYI
jgi:hypothetical protein